MYRIARKCIVPPLVNGGSICLGCVLKILVGVGVGSDDLMIFFFPQKKILMDHHFIKIAKQIKIAYF